MTSPLSFPEAQDAFSPFRRAVTDTGTLPLQETGAVAGKIRAVKSREAQFRQEGMTGSQAGKAAVASVSTVKRQKQKSKKARGGAK